MLLLIVSLIWAFSFGLIKGRLAGLDSTVVATIRLALALLVFVPFLRPRGLAAGTIGRLLAIGAVQFGLMYLLYQRAFAYLPAHLIVLFTLTMPLYVAAFDAVAQRKLDPRHALAAALAMAGAAVVVFTGELRGDLGRGFLLMQASNICFAAGQIAWRRTRAALPAAVHDASVFALPYAGAVATSLAWSLFVTNWTALQISTAQWIVLVYVGVVSSGLCFFWWNVGATRVNAGTLAVFNNLKVPLGVACSLLFFSETTDLTRLLASGALMGAAVWLAEKKPGTVAG